MKPMRNPIVGLSLAGLLASAPLASAQSVWTGAIDDQYLTAGNWSPSGVPTTGAGGTAHINSNQAVIYTPGGDLFVQNGGTLRISAGSWTQVGGIAWIQMGGGHLLVDGGVFNQGTSGNIVLTATSSITVSAGTANFNGNLLYDPAASGALTISGTGTVNVQNEFKPISTFTMSGGTLSANLISFADGPGSIVFSGGTIRVNGGGAFSGFYGGGAKSVDFTPTSVGSLFFSSYSLSELTADGFLTNGTIRVGGMIDASQFTAIEADGGVYIGLTSAIPEPSSFAAFAGAAGLLCAGLRRRRRA